MKQTGIRFTITRLHTFQHIESMVKTLAKELAVAMEEEHITMNEIFKAFKLPLPEEAQLDILVDSVIQQSLRLKVFQYKSIHDIDRETWNNIFYSKGTFDWDGMAILEKSFTGNETVENNWLFNYILIKNTADKIVLATFLTTALWKDDMLSPASISKQIELKRIANPYYLTNKVICCGSLITEGEHLFVDYASPLWRDAIQLLFEKIYALQDLYDANNIVIRDFRGINNELDNVMVDNGFFRIRMPDSYTIDEMNWQNEKEFYDLLSINAKSHLRKKVLRNKDKFKVEVINVSDWKEEIEYWYRLYLNVKNRSLELNTFPLPLKFFYELAKTENWEILQLTITDSITESESRPCCVIFSYKTTEAYIPMIIGMDYTYNQEYNIYRQGLYQVLMQAKKEGKKKILLGFSAGIEKQKLGATANPVFGYMHTKDSFNMEEIAAIPLSSKISNL